MAFTWIENAHEYPGPHYTYRKMLMGWTRYGQMRLQRLRRMCLPLPHNSSKIFILRYL
jgi:hypothetical protein